MSQVLAQFQIVSSGFVIQFYCHSTQMLNVGEKKSFFTGSQTY